MYEQLSGEREDCRLLFTPGHGDIISVQGQTALSLSWILLYKINGLCEFVSNEIPHL